MEKLERTVTSLEVAEMIGVPHWQILRRLNGTRKTRGVIQILTDNKIVVSDYFTESTYQDTSGKENKCYNITKLGCEFLANKFTGEKGILFTARYVKRFHEMEQALAESSKYPQLTPEEIVDWKLNDLHKRVKALEKDAVTVDLKLNDLHKRVKALEKADKPKIHLLTRLTPKRNTWYQKNRNRIWRIRRDRSMELRELYHIILEECEKCYDLDEAEGIYRDREGSAPTYAIDLVEYFPELQDIADQVLDCFESEK